MPFSVTVQGKSQYSGTYTYYTLTEANERRIKYRIPPFGKWDVPNAGYVLTSNNYVIPIIGVTSANRSPRIITPFGKFRWNTWPFCDGRTFVNDILNPASNNEVRDLTNMAYWLVREGDAQLAYRMAFGCAAPPPDELDDLIRRQEFQFILREQYKLMSDELNIPRAAILEERMKQTQLMTRVLEKIQNRIDDGEELDESHIDLFERCFKAQQENLTDLESGYIRTPPEAKSDPVMLEAHYRMSGNALGEQGTRGALNGFHMSRASRKEDDMESPSEGKPREVEEYEENGYVQYRTDEDDLERFTEERDEARPRDDDDA